jgi:hypothetical protein
MSYADKSVEEDAYASDLIYEATSIISDILYEVERGKLSWVEAIDQIVTKAQNIKNKFKNRLLDKEEGEE